MKACAFKFLIVLLLCCNILFYFNLYSSLAVTNGLCLRIDYFHCNYLLCGLISNCGLFTKFRGNTALNNLMMPFLKFLKASQNHKLMADKNLRITKNVSQNAKLL